MSRQFNDNVCIFTDEELRWQFDDSSKPALVYYDDASWHFRVNIDPFPAYGHDPQLVSDIYDKVYKFCPLDPAPVVYVLPYEGLSRTNGWAEPRNRWNRERDTYEAVRGAITLPAKRIPPHPAVTRYLIAHEYGHHVEFALERNRGFTPGDGEIEKQYAEVRGCQDRVGKPYGGGTWHATIGELMANDFRILVTGIETEFWPHEGFARPEEIPALHDWWAEAVDEAIEPQDKVKH